ncbi:integral membrane protein, glucose receptor Git3 [Pseudohyphozyma bogoriensis]|nr:integral membrane protein, glucose receptor Git3 [Pseudohyphozyma bogoriensis]
MEPPADGAPPPPDDTIVQPTDEQPTVNGEQVQHDEQPAEPQPAPAPELELEHQVQPPQLQRRAPPLPPPLPHEETPSGRPSRAAKLKTRAPIDADSEEDDDEDEGYLEHPAEQVELPDGVPPKKKKGPKGGEQGKGSKTRWTKDEDAELLRIIQDSPTLSWDDIAAKLPGRNASGCAMRWYNFVRKNAGPAANPSPPKPSSQSASGEGDAPGLNALLNATVNDDGTENDTEGAEEAVEPAPTRIYRRNMPGGRVSVDSKDPAAKAALALAAGRVLGTPNEGRTIYTPRGDNIDIDVALAAFNADGSGPIAGPSTSTPIVRPGASIQIEPLPDEALVSNPPIPFTKTAVIRGRRTASPGQLEGKLFSPNGKVQKVHACPAENCDAAFKRSEHLKRHYRSVHMGAKPFPCEAANCTKSFSRKDNLQQHMKMVHGVHIPIADIGSASFPTSIVPVDGSAAAPKPPVKRPPRTTIRDVVPPPTVDLSLLNEPQDPNLPSASGSGLHDPSRSHSHALPSVLEPASSNIHVPTLDTTASHPHEDPNIDPLLPSADSWLQNATHSEVARIAEMAIASNVQAQASPAPFATGSPAPFATGPPLVPKSAFLTGSSSVGEKRAGSELPPQESEKRPRLDIDVDLDHDLLVDDRSFLDQLNGDLLLRTADTGTDSRTSLFHLYGHRRRTPYERKACAGLHIRFLTSSVGSLFFSLMAAAIIQTLATSITWAWISWDALPPVEEPTTTAMLIALYLFSVLVLAYNPPKLVVHLAVCAVWVLVILMSSIGFAVQTAGVPFYGNVGSWCWITPDYQGFRLWFHYLWVFVDNILIVFLYAAIGWRMWRNRRASARGFEIKSSTSAFVAQMVLLYPLVYFVCTMPLSSYRLSQMSGNATPAGLLKASTFIFGLQGLLYAVHLFAQTKHSRYLLTFIGVFNCGLVNFSNAAIRKGLAAKGLGDETTPFMDFGEITSLQESLRADIAALRASPYVEKKTVIRGFIYDLMKTGKLEEVEVNKVHQ